MSKILLSLWLSWQGCHSSEIENVVWRRIIHDFGDLSKITKKSKIEYYDIYAKQKIFNLCSISFFYDFQDFFAHRKHYLPDNESISYENQKKIEENGGSGKNDKFYMILLDIIGH